MILSFKAFNKFLTVNTFINRGAVSSQYVILGKIAATPSRLYGSKRTIDLNKRWSTKVWTYESQPKQKKKNKFKNENMDLGIKGRTALITGGDSGIGLETAKLLLAEGVKLILSDLDKKELDDAVNKLKKEYNNAEVIGMPADLIDDKAVNKLADTIKKEHGGIDILVNAAGARGAAGEFLTLSDDDWMQTIQIDLMGAVRVARAFIPQMLDKKWGRITICQTKDHL